MRGVYLFLFLIFKFQLLFLFYLNFINSPIKEINAKVVNQYKKNGYYVLKLKNHEVSFYTTNRDNLKNLLNDTVKLKIFTKNISYLDYLKGFYAPSYDLKLLPLNPIEAYIEKQHKRAEISNLFKALFLGEAIDYDMRKKLSSLGISHLFALSGLHLGFISFLLYFALLPLYKFFHKKYPYRNRFIDLGVVILMVEFLYLYVTNFPPSLIRAYLMEVVLFVFAFFLMDIFSFKILLITVVLSAVFFTFSVFSIGFLLSVLGVFYIYLFLKYFKVTWKNAFILSVYMFVVMFVWSHYFFGEFNNYQLLSPIVNFLFPIFYVGEVFLHIVGMGGVFDNLLSGYLNLGEKFYYVKVSGFFILIYALFSLIAIKKKWAFYGINLLALFVILGSIKI